MNVEINVEYSLSRLKKNGLVSEEEFDELKLTRFEAECYQLAANAYHEKFEAKLKKLGLNDKKI